MQPSAPGCDEIVGDQVSSPAAATEIFTETCWHMPDSALLPVSDRLQAASDGGAHREETEK